MKPAITESIIQSQSISETESKGKVEKKAGKRVGYNYIIIKSYKESQKNDVVKCMYIKSLTDFGFCVIKEGSYGDTKDKTGRDIIDRLRWQKKLHEDLRNKIPIPKLLGHFEEGGNFYLVIEHIKGKALQKLISERKKEIRQSIICGGKTGMQFLDYLIQIAAILEKLHTFGIVHRDATPNNYMITGAGNVILIDMEMCYSLHQQYPTPAFQLGTFGYMSKQQEATMVPTTAEDIFALGAIILTVWSGVSPGKLTNEPWEALQEKVAFFIPDRTIANLVIQCLHPKDDQRPNATSIKQELLEYKNDLKLNKVRPLNQTATFNKKEILASVQEVVNTLATPLLANEKEGWFSNDMKPVSIDDKHKLRKQWYASFNRGAAGVIYMLTQAKKTGIAIDNTLPFIYKGIELIKDKYIDMVNRKTPGLHFGSDGIAAVLAIALENRTLEPSPEYLNWINQLLLNESPKRDIINGVAGQGIANIISRSLLDKTTLQQRLQHYAHILYTQQNKDGSWSNGRYRRKFSFKKIEKVNRGFAQGMAGNIYFLLEHGHTFQHKESITAAQAGLQWIIQNTNHKKRTIWKRSGRDKELNYGWENGIAGIALAFIKAYSITGEPAYRQYAEEALRGIPAEITDGNIGQRNGLSGLGEVYLEAYRTFNETEWHNRAGWIAQVIMYLKKQHPTHGAYWLTEGERQPVGNFMIGNSGVIHFLLRYCHPDKIGFPLTP
jgi:serine/threonine protein kinase